MYCVFSFILIIFATISNALYLPANCPEAIHMAGLKATSGIYKIRPTLSDAVSKSFYVYCMLDPNGGEAWTIIQRRQDNNTRFDCNWNEYKKGFGNLNRNFFIGLDKLHALTESELHELWINMENFYGEIKKAKYESFAIADESRKYELTILGTYSGTAGDALTGTHDGNKFSTSDQDNSGRGLNCAHKYKGGWWYGSKVCHKSNLNGMFLGEATTSYGNGIIWESWHGYYYSLKYVHMAIRPKYTRMKDKLIN